MEVPEGEYRVEDRHGIDYFWCIACSRPFKSKVSPDREHVTLSPDPGSCLQPARTGGCAAHAWRAAPRHAFKV